MFTDERPELVFHLAAILSASGEANPRLAYDVNQTGTWNVLEACRRAKVKRLMFTSSIAVFGPPPSGPLPDPCPTTSRSIPATMYGVDEGLRRAAVRVLPQALRHRLPRRAVPRPDLRGDAGRRLVGLRAVHVRRRVRKGSYDAFARADTRIPLMYMPDGVRALLELAFADARAADPHDLQHRRVLAARRRDRDVGPARASRTRSSRTRPIRCARASSTSWPKAIDDAAARRDWGWKPTYDLDGDDRRSRPARPPHARARRDRAIATERGTPPCTRTRNPSTPQALAEIEAAGLWKHERLITSPQAAHITTQRQGGRSTSARTTTSGCRRTRA